MNQPGTDEQEQPPNQSKGQGQHQADSTDGHSDLKTELNGLADDIYGG